MFDPAGIVELFRTQIGETPYSKLNPLTKFLLFTTFVITSLLSPSLLIQVYSLFAQAPLIILSRSGSRIIRSIKGSLFFIIILLVLNYLTTWSLEFSLAMVLRLVSMIIASAIFMTGISPAEIGDLLTKLRVPLQITFSFVIALRFIPVLADDVIMIITSQVSRGYELEKGGFITRAKKLIPILIPMIVIAIRRGHQLAEALETKAFGVAGRRSSYVIYGYTRNDWIMMIYTIAVGMVAVMGALSPTFQLLPFRF